MRQSLSALGIKVSLTEAKAMIAKQTGDKAGALKDMAFDYKDFLRSHGADVARADAAAERLATEADRAGTDVQNPTPQPSAAHLIIERLRRERGGAAEGYMLSVLGGEAARQRPAGDATFKVSEIDQVGGLTAYLAQEGGLEAAREGYLPRLPGQAFARRAVDDKIFRQGEFTNTVLGEGGIGAAWNDKEGPAFAEGHDAMPGQAPHR